LNGEECLFSNLEPSPQIQQKDVAALHICQQVVFPSKQFTEFLGIACLQSQHGITDGGKVIAGVNPQATKYRLQTTS
jgi:hypothetical protein